MLIAANVHVWALTARCMETVAGGNSMGMTCTVHGRQFSAAALTRCNPRARQVHAVWAGRRLRRNRCIQQAATPSDARCLRRALALIRTWQTPRTAQDAASAFTRAARQQPRLLRLAPVSDCLHRHRHALRRVRLKPRLPGLLAHECKPRGMSTRATLHARASCRAAARTRAARAARAQRSLLKHRRALRRERLDPRLPALAQREHQPMQLDDRLRARAAAPLRAAVAEHREQRLDSVHGRGASRAGRRVVADGEQQLRDAVVGEQRAGGVHGEQLRMRSRSQPWLASAHDEQRF
jgi:hypothetical protein